MRNNEEGFKKAELILKYLRNELDKSQEQALYEWLHEDIENRNFFNKIMNEEGLKEELSFFASSDKEQAWDDFKTRINLRDELSLWSKLPMLKYITAAAALIFVVLGILYFQQPKQSDNLASSYKNDVKSGGNKAVLTLADGNEISLDEANNGMLAQQNNIVITKTAAGQIIFDMKDAIGNDRKQEDLNPDAYNTITTPKGGKYMLILPDGSKVWLNAASSLRFPVSFAKTERKVILKGEAYFEVYKNKIAPFKVIVEDAEVKVLGTHFNIMAYTDEASIKTTLLEGSVNVTINNWNALLKPGEEATITDRIEVGPANTEAVAWKDGFTSFKDADIATIMRSISRWYDIEVNYKGKLPRRLFTGSVSREANLSEVLNSLQYMGGIHFKIDDREVTVIPE